MLCELAIGALFVISVINFLAVLDCYESTVRKGSEKKGG